ncbi:MAG: GTPase Era [Patescibacteria group bacterium]|nr:MAG: GTPase Era [Patescibacteria group bacterium]
MKSGTVLIIGRPNVGKSTLINNLIGKKVAITSPKPQTTRFTIQAVYQDERGYILFLDTPGIFGKTKDALSQKINHNTLKTLNQDADVVVYMVDHTRKRDYEESKVLGIVRQLNKPKKILVINKIDKLKPSYLSQYKFLFQEFDDVQIISALKRKHLKSLIDSIFRFLPEKKDSDLKEIVDEKPLPVLNINSRVYLEELIREKIFLLTRKEIPYTTYVKVEQIEKKENNLIYIKAIIYTTADRYKRMLIGKNANMIKKIGQSARKEIELFLNKKVFLDLQVQINKHWQKYFE